MVFRLVGVRMQTAMHLRHHCEEARTKDYGHQTQQDASPDEAQHKLVDLRGHKRRQGKQRRDHCKRRLIPPARVKATFG